MCGMGVCASAGSGGGASESADPIADGESKLLAELRHMWSDSGGSVVIDIPVRVRCSRKHNLCLGARASRIERARYPPPPPPPPHAHTLTRIRHVVYVRTAARSAWRECFLCGHLRTTSMIATSSRALAPIWSTQRSRR